MPCFCSQPSWIPSAPRIQPPAPAHQPHFRGHEWLLPFWVSHDLALLDIADSSISLPAISYLHALAWAAPLPRHAIPFKVHCLLEAFSDLSQSVLSAFPISLRTPCRDAQHCPASFQIHVFPLRLSPPPLLEALIHNRDLCGVPQCLFCLQVPRRLRLGSLCVPRSLGPGTRDASGSCAELT